MSDAITVVARAVGGVEARLIILKELLEGPKTGIELRYAIARKLGVSPKSISDAKLYFNLQALENSGLIMRYRDWKTKYAEINPKMLQAVRRYLNVTTSFLCLATLDSEPLLMREIVWRLREQEGISLSKCVFIAENKMRGKIGGRTEEAEMVWVNDDDLYDYEKVYKIAEDLLKKLIYSYEPIIDVTDGTRVTVAALQQLAWEYGLRVFYLKGKPYEKRRIVWIK
ncbi:MAG: hypothetical protein KIH01_01045 [Candidatus Freyarchaeota archaeon]|nr:hypothetical protein [Candidatus Jordarchaeia archaeon]